MDDESRKEEQKQFQKKRYRKMYAAVLRRRKFGHAANHKRGSHKGKAVNHKKKNVRQGGNKKNWKLYAVIGMLVLMLFGVMTGMSSCSILVAEAVVTVLTGSYLSEPAEIDAAELYLTELEMELEDDINHVEEDYPDYDECVATRC